MPVRRKNRKQYNKLSVRRTLRAALATLSRGPIARIVGVDGQHVSDISVKLSVNSVGDAIAAFKQRTGIHVVDQAFPFNLWVDDEGALHEDARRNAAFPNFFGPALEINAAFFTIHEIWCDTHDADERITEEHIKTCMGALEDPRAAHEETFAQLHAELARVLA